MMLGKRFIDLTHVVNKDIPTWDGGCGFSSTVNCDYGDIGLQVRSNTHPAGVGTHIDAPSHAVEFGISIDQIPLEDLITRCCVINIQDKCLINANYQITVGDIKLFELEYGIIPKDSVVIANTGWYRYWNNAEKYRGNDTENNLNFPTFSVEAAEFLLERGVNGIAIDTLSPDVDLRFPVHKLVLGAGRYIVENLNNLDLLPPIGGNIMVLPIKTQSETEAMVRAVGVVDAYRTAI